MADVDRSGPLQADAVAVIRDAGLMPGSCTAIPAILSTWLERPDRHRTAARYLVGRLRDRIAAVSRAN